MPSDCLECKDEHYCLGGRNITTCPVSGVFCQGGNIYFEEGYQQFETQSPIVNQNSVFFKCKNDQACFRCSWALKSEIKKIGERTFCRLPQSSISNLTTTCAQGYYGFLCSQCQDGYGLGISSSERVVPTCSKCLPQSANAAKLVAVALVIVAMFLYSLKRKTDKRRASIVRIFVTYLQFQSYINSMSIPWPKPSETMVESQSILVNMSKMFGLVSIDCIVSRSNFSGIFSSAFVTNAFFTLIVTTTLLGIFILSMLAYYHTRNSQPEKEKVFDNAVRISTIYSWFVYSTVTQLTFDFFSCETFVTSTGEISRLRSDLDITCWSPKHVQAIFVVALPLLIIYVIGIPLAVSLDVTRKFHRSGISEANFTKMMNRYAFLLAGYSNQTYGWEVVFL